MHKVHAGKRHETKNRHKLLVLPLCQLMKTVCYNVCFRLFSELADFIVGDDGQPIRGKKKKKHIIHSDA